MTQTRGNMERMVRNSSWDHSALIRALARLAQGRTGVIGDQTTPVLEALRSRRAVELVEPPRLQSGERIRESEAPAPYDTLMMVGGLRDGSEASWEPLIGQLGEHLSLSGRLVACVLNADAAEAAAEGPALTRRQLRRLLRPLGRPRIVSTQPFRWLVMYVQRRSEPVSRSTSERHAAIADLCHGPVLELGCGAGELAGLLAERGLPVLGVDKNEEKIRDAASSFPNARFHVGDIVAFIPPERQYGTVVLAEVLEHVPANVGQRMLDAAWTRVAPGGRLVVSVPNEDCVPHRNHVREFDVRGLRSLLSPLGPPQIVAEQPYKYLLMFVDRPADRPAAIGSTAAAQQD